MNASQPFVGCQRQKAAGVDERCKKNRAPGDQHGVLQGAGRRAGRAAFLKMVEEVDLIVLGRSQDGRADEDRCNIERDVREPHDQKHGQDREQRRNHGHDRGGGAAKYQQEREKNDARRERETLRERGQKTLRDLGAEHPLADH